jgi:nucleolar pre-ribosomal-associated protein 1
LQHLKYLHEGGKVDILKNRGICSSLFQYISTDPADVVTDLLTTIEQNVLKDSDLPRSAKAAILTAQNLERVTEVATRFVDEDDRGTSATALAWLHTVCKTSSYGVLRHHGWYPPGSSTVEVPTSGDEILTGLDEVFAFEGERSFNVRNTTLLSWILSLRPHANTKERELFIATLTAAPELVAAYTVEKSLQMEPKLSNTWIGLASVMFEIVRLPVPAFLGNAESWARTPPNPAIIIENILPRPLTQKVLTRCLNQSSDLISFFAVRILVLAFQKMKSILSDLSAHASDAFADQWAGCREMLIQIFVERCPKMKDVIAGFRQIPDDGEHVLQREAITNLLRLYYEVTPLQALEEQFDISNALTAALLRAEVAQHSSNTVETEELRGLELEHLLAIAQDSPGIRWFHKGSLRYCPIVTLLRMHRKDVSNRQIRKLIFKVLVENGILNAYEKSDVEPPTNALVASVLSIADEDPSWNLLEDCLARASKKPVKYVDDLEAISPQGARDNEDASKELPSILSAVVLEQCPFVAGDKSDQAASKASWMRLFLRLLAETGDSGAILKQLTKQVLKVILNKTKNKTESTRPLSELLPPLDRDLDPLAQTATSKEESRLTFQPPVPESDNHPELFRWAQKDVDLAIEDGDLDALILCLCSQHTDIRRQAHGQIIKARLQLLANATLENSAQLALVLGELGETFSTHHLASDTALPYLTGTFAARAFRIQTQPVADMYPKINKFLIRGPEWRSTRLPGYWFSNTAMSLPEEDDAYWREIRWVLEWLVDGMRTTQDFEILRRGGIFEKVMALAQSPGISTNAFVRDLTMELLFRASGVEGGALSLVTRCGVLSWLDIMATATAGTRDEEKARLLRQKVVESCDEEKLKDWTEGRRKKKIAEMEE